MESLNCTVNDFSSSFLIHPYDKIWIALNLIPKSHYLTFIFVSFIVFLYNFLEIHLIQDLFSGFRGSKISLTFNPSSPVYNGIVSRCRVLHGRYLATPWLSSPHVQTCFLNFFGRPPVFSYRRLQARCVGNLTYRITPLHAIRWLWRAYGIPRQIFYASDGGTIALDWFTKYDLKRGDFNVNNSAIPRDDSTPIIVVVPGLTSDSASAYLKHLAFNMAKHGWNCVISNHRGLGGVSITSDCFYNAGWTEDVRAVIDYLHHKYPKAPLYAVGTSIGANILVKYLGEEGEQTPVAGAAAICNPWDLLVGDRFICRKLVQRFYDRALAFGLQGYAQLHESQLIRLANWEGIKKSRSIRDYDRHATCLVAKYETVDAYYRRCSSSPYVGKVSVPLLCISALDDPLCTKEAIPWDECRANQNVVLATTKRGGHLAFFEGLTGSGLWWVRAVGEYVSVLHSSPYMHVQKKKTSETHSATGSSIDQGPYVNVAEDGMLTAVGHEQTPNQEQKNPQKLQRRKTTQNISDAAQEQNQADERTDQKRSEQRLNIKSQDNTAIIKRCFNQICNKDTSMWLMAAIALATTLPLLRSAVNLIFGAKKVKDKPAALYTAANWPNTARTK